MAKSTTGSGATGDRLYSQAWVSTDLDYLVLGADGSVLYGASADGATVVAPEQLIAAGAMLRIVSETEFLAMIAKRPTPSIAAVAAAAAASVAEPQPQPQPQEPPPKVKPKRAPKVKPKLGSKAKPKPRPKAKSRTSEHRTGRPRAR